MVSTDYINDRFKHLHEMLRVYDRAAERRTKDLQRSIDNLMHTLERIERKLDARPIRPEPDKAEQTDGS